jgi:hypothetical protein
MDEYGLSVTNNSGSVLISNDYRMLVFSERGNFNITSRYTDREGAGSVVFARPIQTSEAPQIFLRHVRGVHSSLGVYITLAGGPGNWTGFAVTSAVRNGSSLQDYDMEFVACKYSNQTSKDMYGLELYDGAAQPIFASDDRVVTYSKFAKNWTRAQGSTVYVFTSDLSIDGDDFVSVSSIDRGVMWFAGGAGFVGMTLLENNLPVLKITATVSGGGYWYYQGVNGTNFCIPVCKFPLTRYYN